MTIKQNIPKIFKRLDNDSGVTNHVSIVDKMLNHELSTVKEHSK